MVKRGALEGRIDPSWYDYLNSLVKFRYPIVSLKKLLLGSPQYGANEIGIERESIEQPRYIRITDINEFGELEDILGKTAIISEEKYFLKTNDLLIARSGNTVGKSYLHKTVNYECFFAGYMIRFKIDSSKVLPDYIFTFTQTNIYKLWVNAIQRSTGQPNINAEEYKSLGIPVPNKEIQAKIVNIYSHAQETKHQKEAVAKVLLASIDAYLLGKLGIVLPEKTESKQTFFTRFKNLQGKRFDPKCYLPENQAIYESLFQSRYEIKTLKDLTIQSVAGDWGSVAGDWGIDEAKNGFSERLVIRATEFDNLYNLNLENDRVKYRYISDLKLSKMDLQVGDLLIEKSGGSENQPVGRVAIITEDINENYNLAYSNFIHKIRVCEEVNAMYLFYFLRTIHNIKITDVMQSQTNGIRNLIMKEFLNIPISLPPLPIQKEIADHITNIRQQAKILQNEAKTAIEEAKRVVEAMILGEN